NATHHVIFPSQTQGEAPTRQEQPGRAGDRPAGHVGFPPRPSRPRPPAAAWADAPATHEPGQSQGTRQTGPNRASAAQGTAAASGDPTFEGAFRRLAESGANAVMVLLPPTEQLVFMGGYRDRGGQAFLSPYPFDAAQTRNFLAASAEYGVAFDAPRVLAWETTL